MRLMLALIAAGPGRPKKRLGWLQRKIDYHRSRASSYQDSASTSAVARDRLLLAGSKTAADKKGVAVGEFESQREWHLKKLRFWEGVQRRWEAIRNWRRKGEFQT